MLNLIDKTIRKAFSDAAIEYDILNSLHKEIARELLKKIQDAPNYQHVLDIGMGTGWLTSKIKFYYPDSCIIGCDLAEGMLAEAKKKYDYLNLMQADAHHLPFKDQQFDIITSNLALQWVNDLPNVLEQFSKILKDDGQLHCSIFGHDTFNELFTSIEATKSFDAQLQVKRLITLDEVKTAVGGTKFNEIKTDYERIKVRFNDFISMIKWIKGIGANTLNREFFVGKEHLSRIEEYYNQHYKDGFGIYATFEVLWLHATK